MAQQVARISATAGGLLLAMALFLGLPAMTMLGTNDAKRARWENRSLAPFPGPGSQASEGSGFFAALDDWLDDHFGLALPLNRLHRRILFYVFRDPPSPQLSLGSGGFVYLNSHDARHPHAAFEGLCDTASVSREYDSLAQSWMHVLRHFQRAGHNTVLGIAPTKPVVYPERLPRSVPKPIRAACLSYTQVPPPALRLAADAAQSKLSVIYPLDAFIAHRENGNFYPKESFHFSGQSAQLFAQSLLHEVGIATLAIDTAPRYDGRITADLQEIFGFKRRIRATQIDYSAFGIQVAYRQPDFIRSCYKRVMYFGTYDASSPITERTALILSDSFGGFAASQLAPAYRKLTWINVTQLQPDERDAFLGDCLSRLSAQDIFFVFHDGSAMWEGRHLEHVFFGAD
jgi:hypothetical protein